MSEESDNGEKTEEPSPEKRRKAREDGNIARSKDAGAIAASAAVLLLLSALGPTGYQSFRGYMESSYGAISSMDRGAVEVVLDSTLRILLLLTLPLAATAALAAILMGMAEAGLMLNWSLVAPKGNRMDPIQKLPKLFAPGPATVMTVLTLLRVVVVALVTMKVISSEMPLMTRLPRMTIEQSAYSVLGVLGRIAFWATMSLGVLSALDYGYSWFKREKSLKMTRQEVKDEHHQQEGDPKVKARQRQRAREMLRRGILQEVKGSDVIVANPTHVAVALRYRPAEGAPVVTAKGVDEIAQYIKKVGREHGVPVVESVQLARALHAQVKVGRHIPLEFFQAVAELLAYVYRLKRRGLRA